MKVNKKLNIFEDAVAIWFKLGYADVEVYSLTTEDAYRTPTAQIVTKEGLNEFLEKW